MSLRKNSKSNLEQKRSAFFLVGLLFTGSFTLAAFSYRVPESKFHKYEMSRVESMPVVFEPEVKEIKIPPSELRVEKSTPSTVNAEGQANENSSNKVNTETDVNSKSDLDLAGLKGGPKIIIGGGIIPIDLEDKAHAFVDKEAEFIGGYEAMVKFVQNALRYPNEAMTFNEQEKIYVRFIVEKDGSISHVKATSGESRSLKKEAERIVKSFPKWKPGELNYATVRTVMTLPIEFKLKP